MRMTESYYFTGDRYADAILTKLVDYLEKIGYTIDKGKGSFEKFYDDANLEKFVEFVFDEFPMTVDTPNTDFDVEWSWNEFLDSKDGKIAREWIEDNPKEIDSAYFLDDLDKAFIAETVADVKLVVNEFCTKNEYGKKLSKKDKQCLIDTINDADIGEFENGYTWGADEFTYILMTDHDGEHEYKDINDALKRYTKYAQEGQLIASWIADYNDNDVFVLYGVDLEEIAKKALEL